MLFTVAVLDRNTVTANKCSLGKAAVHNAWFTDVDCIILEVKVNMDAKQSDMKQCSLTLPSDAVVFLTSLKYTFLKVGVEAEDLDIINQKI